MIKKNFLALNIFFFIISLNAQDDYTQEYDDLLNRTHAERTLQLSDFYHEDIRYSDSITVFKKINLIKKAAKNANDIELLLETELIQLHYYVYRKKFSKDFTVKKIKQLEKIANEKNILWLQIRIQSLLANYLYNFHQEYGLGFEYYEKTAKLLENISIEDFPLKQICMFQIAYVHSQFKEHQKAITYLNKIKNLTSKYNQKYYNPHIYNTLGDSYAQLKRIDSSNYYFKLNLQSAIRKKDTAWIGISAGNLGTNQLNQGNYKKALPLLKKSVKIMENLQDWSFASGRLSDLGQVYLELNDVIKAKKSAKKSNYYRKKSESYSRFLNLYKLQSNIAAHEFKPKIAAKYLDSVFIVKDSLGKIFNETKLLRAKQRIALEKQRFKEEKIKLDNFKKIIYRNTLIVLLGVLVTFMFLRYRKKKKKALNEHEKTISEKNKVEQQLNHASQKLKMFTGTYKDKQEKIEELEKIINESLKENDKNDIESSIYQLKKSSILTEQNWNDFATVFEQVYPAFFEKLKSRYPKITPSEIHLLALSKLELDNKQMALMLGVGSSAIRQIKSRFLKKYSTKEDVFLTDIVERI